MQNRRRIIASVSVVAAAAVTAGVVAGLALSGPSVTSGPSPLSSSVGPHEAGTPSAPAGPASDSATSRPGTTDKRPSADGSASTGGGLGGVETLPETPGVTPSGLPGVTTKPTVAPLPSWDGLSTRAVAARGRLVPGYPSSLLPAAPRATILTSSLSPSTGQVQLALVARRDQAPAGVLRFYRARLARAGFAEQAVAAVGGASAAAFTRGDNRVVVTVDPGRAQTYSVQATFVTGKA
ncbi:hypothetical protein GCM10023350_44100 [Nocardioides endophyticus]|uniref:Uncharacterized protein n=1 Tax=Nocardioides endophyticus TaxID=1353775 RepID=A0ABP8ZE66_9ACTN